MNNAFLAKLSVPERQPFEGNATQKQKQRLWAEGLRDETLIKSLGKEQASALISQIETSRHAEITRRNSKGFLRWAGLFGVATIITLLVGRGSDTSLGIAGVAGFGCIVSLLLSTLR